MFELYNAKLCNTRDRAFILYLFLESKHVKIWKHIQMEMHCQYFPICLLFCFSFLLFAFPFWMCFHICTNFVSRGATSTLVLTQGYNLSLKNWEITGHKTMNILPLWSGVSLLKQTQRLCLIVPNYSSKSGFSRYVKRSSAVKPLTYSPIENLKPMEI